MRAISYLRVSTLDQDVGMQRVAIQAFCSRNNIEIIKEYVDEGVSGAKHKRPAFNKLIDALRRREFDTIICYKLDRIGRNLNHLINLFQEFENSKVTFISVTQEFDTSTASGKLMLHMLMMLAEYERSQLIERINSGLDRARKEGKSLGRPKGSADKKPRRKSGYYQRWAYGGK